jgi:hypothetical protein
MSGAVDEASPTNAGDKARGLGLSPGQASLFMLDTAIVGVTACKHDSRDEAVVALWNAVWA